MARRVGVQLEDQIRNLQQQGLSLRQIAKTVGVAPSTVSRALEREPTHERLAELTQRVAMLERKIALCRECFQIVASFAGQAGRHYRERLESVLAGWPGDGAGRI